MLGPDVLLTALGRPSPLLELRWVGVVREVHAVQYVKEVRVMCPYTLQNGVQLVVAFRLGEPLQSILPGQVVAFAHGPPFLGRSIIPRASALPHVDCHEFRTRERADPSELSC